MATLLPSVDGDLVPELEQELAAQADALARKVAETQERLSFLRELVATVESQLEEDESLLRQLEGLLGRGNQLPLETLNSRLRGARLREVALDILRRRAGDGPVHYRTWYEWVRGEGHLVSGKDPLASFLAAVIKLDCVERVGGARSGRYRVMS
jgi:hypothetical protein